MIDPLQLIYNKNTVNLESIEKTLVEIKQNSFNHLYKIQLDSTGYKRFDLKMSDLKLMNTIDKTITYYPRKYIGFIKEDFIDERYRLLYKRSEFFNKELSLFDIANNSKIFMKTFMVFINGKFFDNTKLLCKGDTTYIIFDIAEINNTNGIPYEYFEELLTMDADISIIIIPNCEYGIYNTNINVLRANSNELALSRFNLVNSLDTESQYITFVNNNSFLFSSVITDSENSESLLRFYDNTFSNFDSVLIHINIFGFRHLLDQIDLIGTDKYFQIPIQNMPIPIENIMIFRNIDGKKYFAHDIQLKLYYPNIYEVLNNYNDNDLTLYVFYSNNTFTSEKYKNELELYHQLTDNVLNKYKDNSISDIIKNFQPDTLVYDLNDFKELSSTPTEYKMNTLDEWVKQNANLLQSYLNNQAKKSDGYYLDISKIDLSTRYRENNYTEIIDDNLREVFNEPRYVFIFRNEFNSESLNLRFFIDGILYIPDKVYKTDKYEFFYIPITLINANSIVEIEKVNKIFFNQVINISSIDDYIELNFPIEISANDVFIIDNNTNVYIDRDKFSLYIKDDENNYNEIVNKSFISSAVFYVKLKDENLLLQNLSLNVIKNSLIYTWSILTEEDKTSSYTINNSLINDRRQFRIFKNEVYILPNYSYNITFVDINTVIVDIIMIKNIGDVFTIEISPDKFKMVYEQDEIESSGLVDLTGLIYKPLDLNWYDIFLNGIKLNKNNIEILSPTKMIIKGINSTKNLVIFEKNRDNEFISIKNSEPSLIDNVIKNIDDFKNLVTSENEDIVDSMPNNKDNVFSLLYNLHEKILKDRFLNPDTDQVSVENREYFTTVFTDDNSTFIVNPDLKKYSNIQTDLELNPNK